MNHPIHPAQQPDVPGHHPTAGQHHHHAPNAQPKSAGLSSQYRRFILRRVIWLSVLLVALLVSVVVNIMTGPALLSVGDVIGGLIDPAGLDPATHVIIYSVRLPFALMAVVIGASLGLAGAEMQTVLNNPLASPSTLGIMHAATLGASLAIVFNLSFGLPENYAVPICAFAGAIIALGAIQFLAKAYGASVDTIVLFGIALVFALNALVSLIQFVANSDSLQQIVFWTMGSLARASWEKIIIVSVVLATCLPLAMRHVWKMTALRGGEDYARSFGVPVERLRLLVLLRVSVLTAVAVAFTGVIGFVGLVGPHISRLAFGEDHRFYIPGSVLAGAFILSMASLVSKHIVPGILIPDGIVTALIGIPLFLALLLSQKRRG
ncbi:FecCD family ABC transporter permease [Thalassospira mesophila]|uniref:FecCD family ABC transporter permease n=1 Tax=Thalassospira mesophila TaxID=1293891 RepID=UPI000A1FC3F4|nr:iron ABC transporter permease [Thalassospira mesophila]